MVCTGFTKNCQSFLPLTKRLLQTKKPVFVFFDHKKKGLLCVTENFSASIIKQLLDEVEHDIINYQNRGLCYLSKPKAEADNTDTRV